MEKDGQACRNKTEKSIPAELKDRLVIEVQKAKTIELVERALKLTNKEPPYRIPWIVFDRDQVKDFDEIIQDAEKSGGTGWSNPCFEIFMYAYFGEMPLIKESYTCYERFSDKFEKVTGQKYFNKDKDTYRKLVQYGEEEKAIQIAERCYKKCVDDEKERPSEMWLACMVQRLTKEINKKCNTSF